MNYEITNKINELKKEHKSNIKDGIFCIGVGCLVTGTISTIIAITGYSAVGNLEDLVIGGLLGLLPGCAVLGYTIDKAENYFGKAKKCESKISELEAKLK